MPSPLSGASDAVGAYFDAKRQNQQDALAAAAQKSALETAAQNRQHQTFEEGRETSGDIAAAKAEAAAELHQQRDDAIRAAQLQLTADKNARDYQLKLRAIDLQHAAAMAKLKNDQTVAQIHATATLGAAEIHASATIQATSMRESGANARQIQSEQFQVGTGRAIPVAAPDVANVLAKGRTGEMKPNEVRSYVLKHVADPTEQAALLEGIATARFHTPAVGHLPGGAIGTMARLAMAALKKQGYNEPADPHFATVLQQFLASPNDRAAILGDPAMPADTKAYLQQLAPLIQR